MGASEILQNNWEAVTRDEILNTNDLKQKMDVLEKNEMLTWQTCEDIFSSYTAADKIAAQKNATKNILMELHEVKAAHSVRMRLKDPVSLIRKIIIKKAENMEKYAHLDVNSYDKLITDLIGARILIRFKHQWKAVHEQLYELFHNGAKNKVRSPVRPNESINNILSMLSDDSDFCYFFEEPVAYVCEEDERAMYLAGGMLDNYIKYSDHKYRSIHYIIRYFGHHVELQVRTIFEEGWSECDHDLYYKESDLTLKEFQKNVSSVLSGLAHQADELSSLMYNTKQKYSIQYQISSNKS